MVRLLLTLLPLKQGMYERHDVPHRWIDVMEPMLRMEYEDFTVFQLVAVRHHLSAVPASEARDRVSGAAN